VRLQTFFSTACLVLMGTIALAQNVTYDFDRGTKFIAFKTYAWVQGPIQIDRFDHARVVNAVNTQLTSKGLVHVEAGAKPDLLVAYHATFDRDAQLTGFSSGWGPYRFPASGSGVVRAEKILTGTLIVDLVDSRTQNIVWRGTASKEIDTNADPGKRDRNINRAAERLFKNYPPVR